MKITAVVGGRYLLVKRPTAEEDYRIINNYYLRVKNERKRDREERKMTKITLPLPRFAPAPLGTSEAPSTRTKCRLFYY